MRLTTRVPLVVGKATVWLKATWNADDLLDRIAAYRRNMAASRVPLWRVVGNLVRQSWREAFQQGGKPRWEPLKAGTVSGKARFLARAKAGRKAPYTARGNYRRSLLQNGREGGVLIKTGKLRDSYVQQWATGHVEREEGDRFTIGSELTISKDVAADKVRHYHLLSKKSLKAVRAGRPAKNARIPLARIHEMGATIPLRGGGTAILPARRVATRADGGPNLSQAEFVAIGGAAKQWVTGDLS